MAHADKLRRHARQLGSELCQRFFERLIGIGLGLARDLVIKPAVIVGSRCDAARSKLTQGLTCDVIGSTGGRHIILWPAPRRQRVCGCTPSMSGRRGSRETMAVTARRGPDFRTYSTIWFLIA